MLNYVFTSSKIGVLYLTDVKKDRYTANPITAARDCGLYLSDSNLILGLPGLNGQDIHRGADIHFEGRPGVTWVRITVHHEVTGSSITTDIPTVNEAEKEHLAFLEDADGRRAVIAGWVDDLVHGV